MYDESEIYVTFDNYNFTEPGNYAEIDNISPGEHQLKIIRYDASMSAQGNVIYDGKIKIPSGFDIYAVIDEYSSFVIYKKINYLHNRCECVSETRRKCGDKTGEKNIEINKETKDECKYKVMKDEDFDDLKRTINSRNFETTNITVVKTAIDKNFLTSEQVRSLLSYFTFENTKLEIAKYSYKKVCDKKNFFKVYDAFNFDSSIEELKNYISGK
jgi:hypothetical protein